MRVYADVVLNANEAQLIAARPASPAYSNVPRPFAFRPADGRPDGIRIPSFNLWNTLEPVIEQVNWNNGQLTWQVADAGWHVPSGLPGWGSSVVVAGHSPARDRTVWSRSVFRQLAYLHPGDEVDLTAGSFIYRYQVGRVFAVSAADANTTQAAAWLAPGLGERLTLVTCWPPNTAAYRVIVVAYPVKSEVKGND